MSKKPRELSISQDLHKKAVAKAQEYVDHYELSGNLKISCSNSYLDGYVEGVLAEQSRLQAITEEVEGLKWSEESSEYNQAYNKALKDAQKIIKQHLQDDNLD